MQIFAITFVKSSSTINALFILFFCFTSNFFLFSRAILEAESAALLEKRTDRIKTREEKQRVNHLDRKRLEKERDIERKILEEERKLVVAERKLESMRLLAELLQRVDVSIHFSELSRLLKCYKKINC